VLTNTPRSSTPRSQMSAWISFATSRQRSASDSRPASRREPGGAVHCDQHISFEET